MGTRWPVVLFDLDGTLLRGTSVSVLTADWLGRGGALDEMERRYRDGLISNAVVAETSASWFAGRRPAEVGEVLERAPWIAGIAETVAELRAAGAYVALATVTWRFAAELVAERFGFEACCGTQMAIVGGRLSGAVSGLCDAEDKAVFVEEVCATRGLLPSSAAVIGDSRSDVPAFRSAGFSVALNADDAARAAAMVTLDADDLRDVLPLLVA
jgi:phosphoserine phosphatase